MADGYIGKAPLFTDVRSFNCQDVQGGLSCDGIIAGWPCQAENMLLFFSGNVRREYQRPV